MIVTLLIKLLLFRHGWFLAAIFIGTPVSANHYYFINLNNFKRALKMKASNTKYLGVLISAAGLFGLTACNSGASNQTADTTASTSVSAQTTPTTPSCLIINLNSTTPNSKTKNNLLLTIQNNCSETLEQNTKSLAFMSQDVKRTPINAPTTFSATADNGKKYSLKFGAVDPQTGLVQSIATKKFTLAPQEGIMMKGNGTLNGVAYDSRTANSTLQIIDKANPLADKCIKAHIMVDYPDAKKQNTATVYVENTCDTPQSLKNKEVSFLSQDYNSYPIAIPQLEGLASDKTNYSMYLNNDGNFYVASKLIPNNLQLDAHSGIELTGSFPLNGSKYDFITAEKTMLVRDIPAIPIECLSGHVFVDPEATSATDIQVAVQNNCDTPQPVYGNDISFIAQDINHSPIWVSTLVAQITFPQKATYLMNFDTVPDSENRMHRYITPVAGAPELFLQPHNTLTFEGPI